MFIRKTITAKVIKKKSCGIYFILYRTHFLYKLNFLSLLFKILRFSISNFSKNDSKTGQKTVSRSICQISNETHWKQLFLNFSISFEVISHTSAFCFLFLFFLYFPYFPSHVIYRKCLLSLSRKHVFVYDSNIGEHWKRNKMQMTVFPRRNIEIRLLVTLL